MKVEIGDLVFCHTIGNKMGWRLNQIGVVVASSKKNTRYRTFLSSGGYDEFTVLDIESGNVELLAKANGEKVKVSKDLEVIPNYMKKIQDAAENIDEAMVDRTFNQRAIVNSRLDKNKMSKSRKRRLRRPGH
jgi:hypothetical protein